MSEDAFAAALAAALSGAEEAYARWATPGPDLGRDSGSDDYSGVDCVAVSGDRIYLVQAKYFDGDRRTGRSVEDFWLSAALRAEHTKRSLDEVRRHRSVVEFGLRLLSSAEDVTGLPSITAPATAPGLAAVWGSRVLPSLDELARSAEEAERFWHVAVAVLAELLGVLVPVHNAQAPPGDSAPCGVIRFAAPVIPRAPGGPVHSPVPSSLFVPAA
ncbi:hypothetical protein HUT18_10630 [Streptomyces sp. NA04227]|uniref:hypothetical protein n=1 Tax=Streptomyces sp. NA04227 TaxID=2742136 RepID=UPI001592AF6D|nr:hypothetical protein [Streptomyces sp. NA04227]QKW06781.1 hypothetical protein HUT18_10630 [Streptomyces sp. NA04227]